MHFHFKEDIGERKVEKVQFYFLKGSFIACFLAKKNDLVGRNRGCYWQRYLCRREVCGLSSWDVEHTFMHLLMQELGKVPPLVTGKSEGEYTQ